MKIRIVPPHPATVEPGLIGQPTRMAAGAMMTYRGGPLLSAVELTAVFLGDWAPAQTQPIEDYLSFLLPSSYLDALSEYHVGHGSYRGSVVMPWSGVPAPPPPPTPNPNPQPGGCLPTFGLARLLQNPPKVGENAPASISDAEIQGRLNAAITSGFLPAKTAQSLYMTFVQAGVQVVMSDGSASCSVFCGYHDSDGNGLYYGVIPYPDCAGCTGPSPAFDALTSVTSHELAEACTDPIPGQSWYNDSSGEIGDPCAWTDRTLGGYQVQLEWLNSKGGCA